METLTYVVLVLILIAFVVTRILRPRPTRSGTVITNPVLGALNLEGLWVEDTIEEDLEILSPYFSEVRRSDDVPPLCDVLLLYGEINSAGTLQNSPKPPNEIIRAAGSSMVVVALNNPLENYSAIPEGSFGSVARMMTIDRRGRRFARFLARLFAQMKDNGITMQRAWVNLAPQHPGAVHDDLPAALCVFS